MKRQTDLKKINMDEKNKKKIIKNTNQNMEYSNKSINECIKDFKTF